MAEETKKGLLERGNEISIKRFDMAYNKVIQGFNDEVALSSSRRQ